MSRELEATVLINMENDEGVGLLAKSEGVGLLAGSEGVGLLAGGGGVVLLAGSGGSVPRPEVVTVLSAAKEMIGLWRSLRIARGQWHQRRKRRRRNDDGGGRGGVSRRDVDGAIGQYDDVGGVPSDGGDAAPVCRRAFRRFGENVVADNRDGNSDDQSNIYSEGSVDDDDDGRMTAIMTVMSAAMTAVTTAMTARTEAMTAITTAMTAMTAAEAAMTAAEPGASVVSDARVPGSRVR